MNRKYLVGVLILGCAAGLAIGRGQESPQRQSMQTAGAPAILVGSCVDPEGKGGTAYILGGFGLGISDGGCGVGSSPTSGVPMPSGGQLQNLRVAGANAPKATVGGVATVWVNGVSTDLSCTVSESGQCSDTTHKIVVKAGDAVAATFTVPFDGNVSVVTSMEKVGSTNSVPFQNEPVPGS